MANKRKSLLILSILLFSLVSSAQASEDSNSVPQFGTGFEEVVIADSSDGLFDPRDLEFHPGRVNELWIANRGDDSMTIVHDTGLDTQTSENRQDSNHNHFLEEVSAIAFGAYHPEFDWQWGSAQETQNTYCGLGSPNQFMGPTLWPSSLDHYAVENQNNGNGLLGSHIDMNHESPDGMGIAHDNGNAYWYFDGYYGELVYYDFQMDHDTGQDDHSDAIIYRYSDIQLTRDAGIPGHMILDKETGILYIADTGASRILWVNTDDTSTNYQNILDPNWRTNPSTSQKEDLAEYARITGVEWGVLDTGLNRPSGIALDGDTLFVSENGNGQISAYSLSEDGKSAALADTVQTNAVFIMGLEIGPDGHLYYVDNGRDQVVRMDPYFDIDADGVMDDEDNCPFIANPSQTNYDGDNLGDACDDDDDNDSVLDENDNCPTGQMGWTSYQAIDHDLDGCADNTEDDDDDNDGINDSADLCPLGETGWSSRSRTDLDADGCRDETEDLDDDNDGICDAGNFNENCQVSTMSVDLCPLSRLGFVSNSQTDNDADGCEDATEDADDDNDGYFDTGDDCPLESGASSNGLVGCLDTDYDGYSDTTDEFPLDPSQWSDTDNDGFGDELRGTDGDYCPEVAGSSTIDRKGCLDSDGDGYSDPDSSWSTNLGGDAFPEDSTQHFDGDGDGFGDNPEGYQPDSCPETFGTSTADIFGCRDSDGDGWSDAADAFVDDNSQWSDQDGDGYGDAQDGLLPDSCPTVFGNSTIQRYGCLDSDGDGLDDQLDAFPLDASETLDTDGDGVGDNLDAYPQDATRTVLPTADETSSLVAEITVGAVLLGITTIILFVIRRKPKSDSSQIAMNDFLMNPIAAQPLPMQQVIPIIETAPQLQPPPQGPPIPEEGLPPGWTMEQWSWYGEDYLRNK